MESLYTLAPFAAFATVAVCTALAIVRNAPALTRPQTCPLLWHAWFAWRPVAASGDGRWIWGRTVQRRRTVGGWDYTSDAPVRSPGSRTATPLHSQQRVG